jgi:hypothetical protein
MSGGSRRELSYRDTFDRTDIPFCRPFVVAAGVRLTGVGRAIPIAIVCSGPTLLPLLAGASL